MYHKSILSLVLGTLARGWCAAALGAAGPHPVAVAEVGPGDGSGAGFRLLLHRSEVGANSARVIWVELAQNPLRSLPFGRLFGR